MKIIFVIFILSAIAAIGQTGYPYASVTTNTTWPDFESEFQPIITWQSGLVERAQIIGVSTPTNVQSFICATNFTSAVSTNIGTNADTLIVYTNVFTNWTATDYGTVSVTNLSPEVYAVWFDGVSSVATAYPVLNQTLLQGLDGYQDTLYSDFCSTAVTGSDGAYQSTFNLATDPNELWIYFDGNFDEIKAHVFQSTEIGYVTNTSTNVYGWITNGAAYWSSPWAHNDGEFVLASCNAEYIYTASNFPDVDGVAVTGVYRWADSEPYLDYYESTLWQTKAAYYRDRELPYQNIYDYNANAAVIMRQYDNARWIIGADPYDIFWTFWYYNGNDNTFYLPGYATASNATSKELESQSVWYEWDGTTTNPSVAITSTVARSIGWNYRAGADWTKAGTLVGTWYVTGGSPVLRYARRQGVTNYEALTVDIAGAGFTSQITNQPGYHATTETATASAAYSPLSTWFCSVSNVSITGTAAIGDSVAVVWTNMESFNSAPWAWNTINKANLDERITALKSLRYTIMPFTAIYATNYKWQGFTDYGIETTGLAAYNYATSHMVAGWTDQGPNPEPSLAEHHYGSTYVEGPYLGTYKAEVVVWTRYYTYRITNLCPDIPHSVDVLINAYDIPNNDVGYNQTMFCDIPGFSTRGVSWIYTNIPSSTNTGHTITLRTIDTNPPPPYAGLYPDYISDNEAEVVGFQSPKMQAVIKWEPTF